MRGLPDPRELSSVRTVWKGIAGLRAAVGAGASPFHSNSTAGEEVQDAHTTHVRGKQRKWLTAVGMVRLGWLGWKDPLERFQTSQPLLLCSQLGTRIVLALVRVPLVLALLSHHQPLLVVKYSLQSFKTRKYFLIKMSFC